MLLDSMLFSLNYFHWLHEVFDACSFIKLHTFLIVYKHWLHCVNTDARYLIWQYRKSHASVSSKGNLQRSGVQLSEGLAFLGIMDTKLRGPTDHHSPMVLKGIRGALSRSPIMPRGVRLSDSRRKFFQSGNPILGKLVGIWNKISN